MTGKEDEPTAGDGHEPNGKKRSSRIRLLVLLAVIAAVVGGFAWIGNPQKRLEQLAEREAALKEYRDDHLLSVCLISGAVYVVVTGLSLPGATVMTVFLGWFLGFWRTLIIVSFASTAGATLAFLVSRYLFRNWVERRFGDRLQKIQEAFEREGKFYLFFLRLVPVFPFFLVNLVMGLTPIRVRTYWWVSQVGMLPGTAVYVLAGSRFPDLETLSREGVRGILRWDLALALALLGAFPLVVKRAVKWWRERRRS